MIKVSVVVPVYNKEKHLHECLDSIMNQTLTDLEIICVDDGSTDNSLSIIEEYAEKDKRISIIKQENLYAGVARNKGMEAAQGEYIAFIDADDYIDLDFFEVLYKIAKKNEADVVKSPYKEEYEDYMIEVPYNILLKIKFDQNLELLTGHHSTVIWNAIYRLSFLKENNILFQNVKHANDVLFSTKVSVYAQKSFPVVDVFYFHRKNVAGQLTAGSKERIYVEKYVNDCVLDFLLSPLTKYMRDADFYYSLSICLIRYVYILRSNFLRKNILEEEEIFFAISETLKRNVAILDNFIGDSALSENKIQFYGNIYKMILTSDYEEYKKYINTEIILSLTSYPDRISTVHQTINTLLTQHVQAQKIILWLAESQFPNKENDLPQNLLKLTEEGLTIHYCEDIKSYKKLIPTLKMYPDKVIVTVDDDVLYPPTWLHNLCCECAANPQMIYAHRIKKIEWTDENTILPYENWDICYKNSDNFYSLIPIGCGGILYPPNCFHEDILKEDLFMKLVPHNNDIWFWAMAVLNYTKINLPEFPQIHIDFIEKKQLTSFCQGNMHNERYDLQLSNVLEKYPQLKQIIMEENIPLAL